MEENNLENTVEQPEEIQEEVVAQPEPVQETVQPVEPEQPIQQEPAVVEEPVSEVSAEPEKAPVAVSWKKPIIWMIAIGVGSILLMLILRGL